MQEASILSASYVEGEAIYLTLQWGQVPNLYRIPWDRDTAEQLQQAMRDAQRDGSTAMMRLPFEPSWDRNEPRFYALPQPKMPDKPAPGRRDRVLSVRGRRPDGFHRSSPVPVGRPVGKYREASRLGVFPCCSRATMRVRLNG